MPPPALISAVVTNVPGVDKADYKYREGGRPITLTGLNTPDQIYTFPYRGQSNVIGTLQFVVDYKGGVKYSQSLTRLGARPSQECIDATRVVMLQIESGLEKRCGLTNLSASVREIRQGVK